MKSIKAKLYSFFTSKKVCRQCLYTLFLTNALLVLISMVHGEYGMVRYALATSHLLVGFLFIVLFFIWAPFTLLPYRSLFAVSLYWAAFFSALVAKLLIVQIFHLISFVVCTAGYTLLFFYFRRKCQRQGYAYPLRDFIPFPLFSLIIWFGLWYYMEPAAHLWIPFAGHVLFSVVFLFILCFPFFKSFLRGDIDFLKKAIRSWRFFLPAPFLVAAFACLIGSRMADDFGEEKRQGLYADLIIPVEQFTRAAKDIPDPYLFLKRNYSPPSQRLNAAPTISGARFSRIFS